MRWLLSHMLLLFGSPRRAYCTCLGIGFVLLADYDYGALCAPQALISEHAVSYVAFGIVVFLLLMFFLGWLFLVWMQHKRCYATRYSHRLILWLACIQLVTLALEPEHSPLDAAPVLVLGLLFYCIAVVALLVGEAQQQYQSAHWYRQRTRAQKRRVLTGRYEGLDRPAKQRRKSSVRAK